MWNTIGEIRDLCNKIIEDNKQYKTEDNLFVEGTKRSLIDDLFLGKTLFDVETNLIVEHSHPWPRLVNVDEIEQDALTILKSDNKIVFDDKDLYLLLHRKDVRIWPHRDFKKNNLSWPISEIVWKIWYNEFRDKTYWLFVISEHGYLSRVKSPSEIRHLNYITLATEEELKKVLGMLEKIV